MYQQVQRVQQLWLMTVHAVMALGSLIGLFLFSMLSRFMAFKKVLTAPFIAAYLAVMSLFVPMSASAAIDVTSALGTFSDVNTAIPLVGAAFLAALGILAAWKLIRGAFA